MIAIVVLLSMLFAGALATIEERGRSKFSADRLVCCIDRVQTNCICNTGLRVRLRTRYCTVLPYLSS